MALIKCPECGKEISDKAKTCINCGFPIKQKSVCTINGTEHNLSYILDLVNSGITDVELIQKKNSNHSLRYTFKPSRLLQTCTYNHKHKINSNRI